MFFHTELPQSLKLETPSTDGDVEWIHVFYAYALIATNGDFL